MKRLPKVVVFVLSLAICFSMFAACAKKGNDDKKPENQPSVTLSQSTLEMDLYETATLTAQTENTEEAVVWSSSDPATATVEDGVVTSLKEGKATITAAAGKASATCEVTVESSGAIPTLTLSAGSATIKKGSDFDVGVSMTYKNKAVDADFSYTPADASIVSATATENGVTLSGLKIGSTNVVAKGVYNGFETSRNITVTVTDDVTFTISTASADLFTAVPADADEGEYPTETTITVTNLIDNGEQGDVSSVVWSSDNEAVAKVANGVITAQGAGEAIITATYTSKVEKQPFSNEVKVTVSRPDIETGRSADIQMKADDTDSVQLNLADTGIEANGVVSVEIAAADGSRNEIEFNKANNALTFKKADLTEGDKVFFINTAEFAYKIKVCVLSKLIVSADEFKNMESYLTLNETTSTLNGYIALGQNLDFGGEALDGIGEVSGELDKDGLNPAGLTFTDKFGGIFDGRGFTLSNFVINEDFNSLFAYIDGNGIVRNFGLTDVEINGARGGIVSTYNAGEISDVFIQGEIVNGIGNGQIVVGTDNYSKTCGATALVTSTVSFDAVMHDIFAVCDNWAYNPDNQAGIIIASVDAYQYAAGAYTGLYNLYAINGKNNVEEQQQTTWANKISAVGGSYSARGTNHLSSGDPIDKNPAMHYSDSDLLAQLDPENPMAGKNIKSFIGGYAELAVWLEENDFAGFDSDVWTKAGKLPVMKSNADIFGFEEMFKLSSSFSEVRANGEEVQLKLAGECKYSVSYKLKEEIAGVTLTADGKLTVDATVAHGTQITVLVYSSVYPAGVENVISVYNLEEIDMTDTVIADILAQDGSAVISIEGLSNVTNVMYGDTELEFTADGENVTIASSELLAKNVKTGEKRISILADKHYDVLITVVANIDTAEEFIGMKNYLEVVDDTITGMINLNGNVNFEGATIDGLGQVSGSAGAYVFTDKWAGTFDGKGYTLSNFTVASDFGSLFAYITDKGSVKNLAIVNATIKGAKGGIVSTVNEGEISNLFIKGEIVDGKGNSDALNSTYGKGFGATSLVTSTASTGATMHDIFAVLDNWNPATGDGNNSYGDIIIGTVVKNDYVAGKYSNLYNLYAVNAKAKYGIGWADKMSAIGNDYSCRGTNTTAGDMNNVTDSDLIAAIDSENPMANKNIKSFIFGYAELNDWLQEENSFAGFDSDVWTKTESLGYPVFKTSAADVESTYQPTEYFKLDSSIETVHPDTPVTLKNGADYIDKFPATFTLKTPIDGVTLENNVLTVAATVPHNTVITVVANSAMFPVANVESTLTVYNVNEVDLTDDIIDLSTVGENITFDLGDVAGKIDSVKYNDTDIAFTEAEGVITISKAEFLEKIGAGEFVLNVASADDYFYDVTAIVADKILTTEEEFKNMRSYLTEAADNSLTGYIVLGNDLDFGGETLDGIGEVSGENANYVFTDKFAGTFDGQGHTLSNFKIAKDYTSLFTYIAKEGVVKNFAIIDASIEGARGGIVATINDGEISNLFVKGKIVDGIGNGHVISAETDSYGQNSGATALVVSTVYKVSGSVHDVFAVLDDWNYKEDGQAGIIVGIVNTWWYSSGNTYDTRLYNLYAINGKCNVVDQRSESWGNKISAVGGNTSARGTNTLQGEEDLVGKGERHFTDSDLLAQCKPGHVMADNNVKSFIGGWAELAVWVEENDFVGFDADVWTKEGKLPVFKTASDVYGLETALTINEKTIAAGSTETQLTLAGDTKFPRTFQLQEAVEGVTLTEDGKITVADTVAADTQIKIVVTSPVYPDGIVNTISVTVTAVG